MPKMEIVRINNDSDLIIPKMIAQATGNNMSDRSENWNRHG
jgi:hypothetical protein